jgi:hypothetical protein
MATLFNAIRTSFQSTRNVSNNYFRDGNCVALNQECDKNFPTLCYLFFYKTTYQHRALVSHNERWIFLASILTSLCTCATINKQTFAYQAMIYISCK